MKTPNTVNGFQNNSSFSEAFSTKIQAAGVEPVMKPTRPTERDEDKAAILEQRKSAVDFWSTAKSGTLKKNKTQLALFDPHGPRNGGVVHDMDFGPEEGQRHAPGLG